MRDKYAGEYNLVATYDIYTYDLSLFLHTEDRTCKTTALGGQYLGNLIKSHDGKTCQRWDVDVSM